MVILWHLESTLFLLDKVDALFWIFVSATRRIYFEAFSELVPGYAKFYVINFIYLSMDFLFSINDKINLSTG